MLMDDYRDHAVRDAVASAVRLHVIAMVGAEAVFQILDPERPS